MSQKFRIVILSTESAHHTYFINRLSSFFVVDAVIYETEKASFPFDTSSPFEEEEQEFEQTSFFKDVADQINNLIPVFRVPSVNDKAFKDIVKERKAELGLVFGCGKIQPSVFQMFEFG